MIGMLIKRVIFGLSVFGINGFAIHKSGTTEGSYESEHPTTPYLDCNAGYNLRDLAAQPSISSSISQGETRAISLTWEAATTDGLGETQCLFLIDVNKPNVDTSGSTE